MQGESSNIAKFTHECIIFEIDNWISNADLYEKYQEYCLLNAITPESDQMFGKEFKRYCTFGKFHNQSKEGKWGVKNIKVKHPLPIMGI